MRKSGRASPHDSHVRTQIHSVSIPFTAPGYHTVTPSLTIRGAAEALEFYKKALNAVEVARLATPDGVIMHAEIQFGDSRVMISDEFPDWGSLSPQTIGGSPGALMIYVPDVDAAMAQAVAAGATEMRPATDQFWGDRSGMIIDPYGHRWSLATHREDVSMDEIGRRAAAWMKSPPECKA
jgi:PhnB protein